MPDTSLFATSGLAHVRKDWCSGFLSTSVWNASGGVNGVCNLVACSACQMQEDSVQQCRNRLQFFCRREHLLTEHQNKVLLCDWL